MWIIHFCYSLCVVIKLTSNISVLRTEYQYTEIEMSPSRSILTFTDINLYILISTLGIWFGESQTYEKNRKETTFISTSDEREEL